MFKGTHWLRDLLFAIALVILTKELVIPYIAQSIHEAQNAPAAYHDIGPEGRLLVAQAEKLSHRVDELLSSAATYGTQAIDRLREIKAELKTIATRYTKDSPASALLGPLGTTATVLRESKLQERFTELVNEIKSIGNRIAHAPTDEEVTEIE